MKQHLYKTIYLLFLVLSMAACKKDSEAQPPAAVAPTKVTIENYNLITVNMTFTQVTNILGTGKVVTPDNYSWSADETNTILIYITFSNGTVKSKSQKGLASVSSGGGSTTGSGCPSSYNGHTVHTGPRGGCYYINSKGNKTYI